MIRASKYNAIAEVVDGIRFASKREARRYGQLRLLEKARRIAKLALQPKYPLAVADKIGVLVVIGVYRGDFEYVDAATGELVIEDAKGVRTPLYRWKKKHFEAQYGLRIREV